MCTDIVRHVFKREIELRRSATETVFFVGNAVSNNIRERVDSLKGIIHMEVPVCVL